jgi:hypothetical protein
MKHSYSYGPSRQRQQDFENTFVDRGRAAPRGVEELKNRMLEQLRQGEQGKGEKTLANTIVKADSVAYQNRRL